MTPLPSAQNDVIISSIEETEEAKEESFMIYTPQAINSHSNVLPIINNICFVDESFMTSRITCASH